LATDVEVIGKVAMLKPSFGPSVDVLFAYEFDNPTPEFLDRSLRQEKADDLLDTLPDFEVRLLVSASPPFDASLNMPPEP
jgi:hypothetical protein